jgi:lipopolysaccharide transport system ATP-binding protein
MAEPVIEVESLSKQYLLHHRPKAPYGSLRDDLVSFGRNPLRFIGGRNESVEHFWALKDVSFSVQTGDAIGIIGRNGSGKSTLLKILSRIVDPTAGKAILRGEVASLLEVGTGFHPELTGRENIYFNGSILGMTRRDIARKFDEIVAFAETEKFLDTPVKFYSSGMYVRLAFAVAAHLEPEILIVDEVLAVGDTAFQTKCLARMHTTAQEGRTVLFVSHNLQAIRMLCRKGIVLNEGRLLFTGTADEAADHYLKMIRDPLSSAQVETRRRESNLTLEARIHRVTVDQAGFEENASIDSTKPLAIHLQIESSKDIDRPVAVHVAIINGGTMLLRFESEHNGAAIGLHKGTNCIQCRIQPTFLAGGYYSIDCSILYPGSEHIGHIDAVSDAATFTVRDVLLRDGSAITQREAVYSVGHVWETDH